MATTLVLLLNNPTDTAWATAIHTTSSLDFHGDRNHSSSVPVGSTTTVRRDQSGHGGNGDDCI